MLLSRIIYFIIFLFALHFQLKSPLNSGEIDVIVSYENEVSISSNKDALVTNISAEEADEAILRDKDVFVGSYIITVTSDLNQEYNVIVFAKSEYVNSDNRFVALTNETTPQEVKLAIIADKNPDGTDGPRPLFDRQVVIAHNSSYGAMTTTVSIDVYILKGALVDTANTSSFFPIIFKLEGL